MPIGYYSQNRGSEDASPQVSNYISDAFSANLVAQLDAQVFEGDGVSSGTALSTLTAQTGESIAPLTGYSDGTYEENAIGTHPALQLGNNQIIAMTPSSDMTLTDWTIGLVVKTSDISIASLPFELYTNAGAYNQNVGILRQGGATFDWVVNYLIELGSGSLTVNVGADYDTALVIVRYEESTRNLDHYVFPIGGTATANVVTLPVSRTLQYQTQPEIRLGSTTNSTIISNWVGEFFILDIRLTDTQVVTQVGPDLVAKWS